MPERPISIRAVIFDMDGLMLDTEPPYRKAWQQAATECGYWLPDTLYSRLIGRTRIEGERILQTEFGPAFPRDQFQSACQKFETLASNAAPYRRSQGSIAIPQLLAVGLLRRFHELIIGDEVLNGKPAPDACLVLGDSEAGVMAANHAGMPVYMVPDMLPPSTATRQAATGVFHSLEAKVAACLN